MANEFDLQIKWLNGSEIEIQATDAVSLDGTEKVLIMQDDIPKETTAQAIADLGGGGGSAPIVPPTQIPFGNGTDPYTSSSDFVYDATGYFSIGFSSSRYFQVTPTTGLYEIGDLGFNANGSRISIDDINLITNIQNKGQVFLGDYDAAVNNTFLSQNDVSQILTYQKGTSKYLSLDIANGVYQIGDLDASANNNLLILNDTYSSLVYQKNSFKYLSLDVANGNYYLGDMDGSGTGTRIEMQDGGSVINYFAQQTNTFWNDNKFLVRGYNVGGEYLSLDITNGVYGIGDLDGVGNDTKVVFNDANRKIEFYAEGSFSFQSGIYKTINLDIDNNIYSFGDLVGILNNTKIIIDDNNAIITLNASNGIIIPVLPVTDPAVAGALWNDAGTLKISAG